MKPKRQIFVLLHRYVGLTLALFLIILGLTGSIIAFYHELDELFNPELFHVAEGGKNLPPGKLVKIIQTTDPHVRVQYVQLGVETGHSASIGLIPAVNPATSKPYEINYDEMFVNPATGEILGKRKWGAFKVDRMHLMPFIYQLHMSLHIPGTVGLLLIGGVALVWMFDCFIGFYLTLPRGRPFFQKWKPAWRIKTDAGAYRINFDFHRAAGLWLWGLLFMVAISGVSFNLHEQVFEPVVSLISPITPSVFDTREESAPEKPIGTKFSFDEMVAMAKAEGRRRGLPESLNGIFYSYAIGVFGAGFGKDHPTGLGTPWVYFDGKSGKPVDYHIPGEGTAGDIFHQLQYPLHSGQVAGLPGRILICISGIVVAALSITGIIIWWKKRVQKINRSIFFRTANIKGEAME